MENVQTFILERFDNFTSDALKFVKLIRLDKLLDKLTPIVTNFLAFFVWELSFGTREVARRAGGRLIAYSTINVTDPTFRPPTIPKKGKAYDPRDFPFVADAKNGLLDGVHEWRAHFLSLCVKAAYEDKDVFADITQRDWSFKYEGMLMTEDPENVDHGVTRSALKHERRKQLQIRFGLLDNSIPDRIAKAKARVVESFIPQTRAFVVSNSNAVILVFRGTEPTNLVQWVTDATCERVKEAEVEGKVHEGFYTALFYHSKAADGANFTVAKHAMFRRICEALYTAVDGKKALYITGHSLGGALVTVMAHCIAKLANDNKPIPGWPEGQKIVKTLMAAILMNGGVYTFAGPLVGENKFRDFMEKQFGSSIFRIVHAGDLVPRVPPYNLGFCHHVREYYLTTFGDLCSDPQDIEHKRGVEIRPLSFMCLYAYKIVEGVFLGESFVRTLERLVLMVTVPGLTDHWPSDYERKLRKYAIARSSKGVTTTQNGATQNGSHYS